MDLVDCTRISPALAKKLAPSGTIGRFSERMSQVASTGCSCAGEPGNIVSYLSEKSDAVEREAEMLDLYHRLCIPYVRLNLHLPGAIGRASRSGARSSHAQKSRVVRVGKLLKSPTTDDLTTGAGSTRCTRGFLTPLHSFLRMLCERCVSFFQ